MTRRRRGWLLRQLGDDVTAAIEQTAAELAAGGHALTDDVVVEGADVIDLRLAGHAPRVEGKTTVVDLVCPKCSLPLQVVVADGGPADWRHAAPPCPEWLAACHPNTANDFAFRDVVARATRAALAH